MPQKVILTLCIHVRTRDTQYQATGLIYTYIHTPLISKIPVQLALFTKVKQRKASNKADKSLILDKRSAKLAYFFVYKERFNFLI